MAPGHGAHRSRTPKRPGPGRPPGPGGSPRRSLRSPRTGFWAGLLLEQVDGSTRDLQLGLELGDLLLRGCQFALLGRGQTGLLAAIDTVLAAPVVDRLVADVEIVCDASDRSEAHTSELQSLM